MVGDSLRDVLDKLDAGFSETLLKLHHQILHGQVVETATEDSAV